MNNSEKRLGNFTSSEIEWVDIAPGKYQINKDGVVRSLVRIDSMGRIQGGFNIKSSIGRGGYYSVSLRITNKQKTFFLHRLIAQAFIPNPENKPCVNHKNSNRLDNSIQNLEWCTISENNSHAHTSGHQSEYYGEKHHRSKINQSIADEIRCKYQKGKYTLKNISADYNLSVGAVYALLKNKTWIKRHNN